MTESLYGVGSNLQGVPNKDLERLLDIIDRHGKPTDGPRAIARERIKAELEARKKIGVDIPKDGQIHHPV